MTARKARDPRTLPTMVFVEVDSFPAWDDVFAGSCARSFPALAVPVAEDGDM